MPRIRFDWKGWPRRRRELVTGSAASAAPLNEPTIGPEGLLTPVVPWSAARTVHRPGMALRKLGGGAGRRSNGKCRIKEGWLLGRGPKLVITSAEFVLGTQQKGKNDEQVPVSSLVVPGRRNRWAARGQIISRNESADRPHRSRRSGGMDRGGPAAGVRAGVDLQQSRDRAGVRGRGPDLADGL